MLVAGLIVRPKPSALSLFSLAHGAGRKWIRGDCKARLRNKYHHKDLLKTQLGSQVICADRELLYEEAPEAYKSCDSVIAALQAFDLIELVARLRPVLTYKTQGGCAL